MPLDHLVDAARFLANVWDCAEDYDVDQTTTEGQLPVGYAWVLRTARIRDTPHAWFEARARRRPSRSETGRTPVF